MRNTVVIQMLSAKKVIFISLRKRNRSDSFLWQYPLYRHNIKKVKRQDKDATNKKHRLPNDCGPTKDGLLE